MSCFVAFQRNNENLYQDQSPSSDFIIFIKRNVINSRSNVVQFVTKSASQSNAACVSLPNIHNVKQLRNQVRHDSKINAPYEGRRSVWAAAPTKKRYIENRFFFRNSFLKKNAEKMKLMHINQTTRQKPSKTVVSTPKLIHNHLNFGRF